VKTHALTSALLTATIVVVLATPSLAQQGQVLTELENQISVAARGWQDSVLEAARSLFWILAAIEVGIAAIMLAINAASLDGWFAELVRRIMFIGFFAFVLSEGPEFARAVVDSLFQIGARGRSASPAEVFDAGIKVASAMSKYVRFGILEENGLAIAAIVAMSITVVSFSLVAAIFVSVMVEMYVGLLAGMIMLGLGGSSFTKDFAVRYLVYAFSVGMKLMSLVMIARIGSDTLVGLAQSPVSDDERFITNLAIAGISVVVFIVAMYVPNIIQGVVQGVSVTGGMEAVRHGGQASSAALGAAFLTMGGALAAFQAARGARSGGSSVVGAALKGSVVGAGSIASATASAAKEKAIGSPGAHAGSLLGLANAKLDGANGQSGNPARR